MSRKQITMFGEVFNTNQMDMDQVAERRKKNVSLDMLIMELFNSRRNYSPSQLHRAINNHYPNRNTPITSVRRSLSVLTGRNLLIKTSSVIKGQYGANEHIWQKA